MFTEVLLILPGRILSDLVGAGWVLSKGAT